MFAINMLLWLWHTYNENNRTILYISLLSFVSTAFINFFLTAEGITTHTSWYFILCHPMMASFIIMVGKFLSQPFFFSKTPFAQTVVNSGVLYSNQQAAVVKTPSGLDKQKLDKISKWLVHIKTKADKLPKLSTTERGVQHNTLFLQVDSAKKELKQWFALCLDTSISYPQTAPYRQVRRQLSIYMKQVATLVDKTDELTAYLGKISDRLGIIRSQMAYPNALGQLPPDQQAKAQAYWNKNQQCYTSLQIWQHFDPQKNQAFWQYYDLMLMVAKNDALRVQTNK
ncbi:hypothetical protein M23134_04404 [Microscilla marina ATCC 23134]|uniref:Uncharacterized protein n=2 Tax=Microscilla marina TaxID=1027 RepID=A1ZM25_MICM2|nr:hypothetical protein M23134_04404 [Microscilla marina ATCC 23134]